MLDALTADDFQPHVGAAFQLTPADGEPIASELIEVEGRPMPEGAARPPFALLFRTQAGASLEQGLHRVEREGGDAHEIFLVPVGPDLLEAVFN